MRCHRALLRTCGFLSRASCTRFSPMCVTPAAMASSMRSEPKVFETATSVTSLRLRPARSQAARILPSTAARFSAIVTMLLHITPLAAIDRQIREAIGLFVSRAERVADRKIRKVTREASRFLVQRYQILVFDAKFPQHLIHQKQRIGDDLDIGGPFFAGESKRLEKAGVLRDIVGGDAQVAGDYDDGAGVGGHVDPVAGRTGIAARRAIDIGGHLQD